VRTKVFELARLERDPQLMDGALAELRAGASSGAAPSLRAAARYVLVVSSDAQPLLRELLQSPEYEYLGRRHGCCA
jgi:hypothetical protein